MKRASILTLSLLLGAAALWSGCETFGPRSHHRATSLMKYLYPDKTRHTDEAAIPTLSLPLKVGVAFVPVEDSKTVRGVSFPVTDTTVNEGQKMALMKEVSRHFKQYPFVKSIDLIPSAYLTPGGSFENLEQLRSMFGVDVIALLSYDQVQFIDEGFLSLSYWTIVGIYTVEGEKNDTRTMLDAVVYDIPSRQMLFRAPGISHVKGSSTPVNLSEELRHDSERGFREAATNLVVALDSQLAEFRDRARSNPEEIKIIRKPGYTGSGALGGFEALLVAGMAVASLLWGRRML